MDLWMDYESKAWDRREAERQRAMQRLLHEKQRQYWHRRTALRCGLVLMRCARRLIAYGKPAPEQQPGPTYSFMSKG